VPLKEFWEVRGLYSEGRAFLEQALAECKGSSISARASALGAAARFADWLVDFHRAEALYQESLGLYRELGDTRGIASSLRGLSVIVQGANIAVAIALLEESVALLRELGDKEAIAWSLQKLADKLGAQGEYARANALFEESLALCQEMGDRWNASWALADLGRIKAYRGDVSAALTFHGQSLEVAREIHEDWPLAYCLEGWASVVATQGKCAWAARLWGAAESSRERCGIPLSPVERVDYEPAVAAARTWLGEQEFTTAWAEGRTKTLEQVLSAPE
jgi:tetratricopeptide (TPR) repeat protein